MSNHYEQLQVQVYGMLDEMDRRRIVTANFLDRVAGILRKKVGFPDGHVWFKEALILWPDSDKFEIAKARAEREAQPPTKMPRAYGAIKRDMFVGGLKVDMGFRVSPSTGGEMECSVPLMVSVEGDVLTFTMPKPAKTEVKIDLADIDSINTKLEDKLIVELLGEIAKMTKTFLEPGHKERIGFKMPEKKDAAKAA